MSLLLKKYHPDSHNYFSICILTFLNLVFVFVYTVIEAGAVRTRFDKKLIAKEFLFLSREVYFFRRNRLYEFLWTE